MGSLSTDVAIPMTAKDVQRGETLVMVSPANPTPTQKIYLSNIDQSAAFPVETIFFYEMPPDSAASTSNNNNNNIIERVKKAVAEDLLIPYYFMTGRLQFNPESRRLELVCNNAGALFAGATSIRSVKELGNLYAPNPSFQHLILRADSLTDLADTPILSIQVTTYRCGGFSIGLMTNHSILDGKAAIEFFENLAAICRGDERVKAAEFHVDRSYLKARDPPQIKFSHAEYTKLTEATSFTSPDQQAPRLEPVLMAAKNYEYKVVPFGPDMFNALKQKVSGKCSSFEAIVAHVWRARTQATFDDPTEISSVLFAVDIRSKVSPALPQGFVGNAVITTMASAKVAELEEKPLSFAVEKVKEAIERVTDEYVRSAVDWLEVHRGVPSIFGKNFLVSAWWKLPFHELDFGFGKSLYGGPVVSNLHEFVLLLSDGKGGINLWLALEEEKMNKFLSCVFKIQE